MCSTFALTVLLVTAIWVYILKDKDFTFLAYAMFLPGLFALVFILWEDSVQQFFVSASGVQHPLSVVIYSALAILLVYTIVEACAFVALSLGWAKTVPVGKSSIHGHNSAWIHGFLRAGGEELGWRCYLLPCMMDKYRPEYALLISGIVWGLYHVPIMALLSKKLNINNPYTTITVQFLSCVMAAFPHGWLAVKSGYSLWAPTLMHWFWNRYNPTVLGSIYTNSPGRLQGQQWLINGEGLNGCLVMVPVAIAVIVDLKYAIL